MPETEVVICASFNGFGWGVWGRCERLIEHLNGSRHNPPRTHPKLIAFVKEHPALCGALNVVTLPPEVTDWTVVEVENGEVIFYVWDGKIFRTNDPFQWDDIIY